MLRTYKTSTTYNPSALTDIDVIACDTSSNAISVIIPTEDIAKSSDVSRRQIVVSDDTGNASVNNITITLENGGTINGSSSLVVSGDYNSVTILLDGTNGKII